MLNDITIIDLETTGLSPFENRITEIAARRYQNGVLVNTFEHLVWACQEVPEECVQLNGLTTGMLQDHGLDEDLALRTLRVFMGNSILIAHNASFEVAWLHQAGLRLFNKPLTNHFLCTKTMAVGLKAGSGKSYSLKQLAHDYGIEWQGAAHRAMPDVRATTELLHILLALPRGHEAASQLLNYCGQKAGAHYPVPEGLPGYATVIPQ